jgi:hypothetical protein
MHNVLQNCPLSLPHPHPPLSKPPAHHPYTCPAHHHHHHHTRQVSEVYRASAGELVSRFREREESVKGDIFGAVSALIKQVRARQQHRTHHMDHLCHMGP